jgi:hypothetical protein
MIKTCLFISGKVMTGGEELVELWHKEPASIIWLDLFENTLMQRQNYFSQNLDYTH